MNRHPDDATLQRHLDGYLPAAESWTLEGHLRECADCTRKADELRELVGEVAALAASVEPPADLWPEIAARIAATLRPPAIPIRRGRPGSQGGGRLLGWAVAIAATLALGVGLGRTLPRPGQPVASAPVAPPAAAVLASYDEPMYDQAIADLQLILDGLRDRLRPETIATLEENLAIIDQAMADARTALLADPANDHLHRHLAANMQTKLGLLRMVTSAVSAEI
jgi:hypothetical protein